MLLCVLWRARFLSVVGGRSDQVENRRWRRRVAGKEGTSGGGRQLNRGVCEVSRGSLTGRMADGGEPWRRAFGRGSERGWGPLGRAGGGCGDSARRSSGCGVGSPGCCRRRSSWVGFGSRLVVRACRRGPAGGFQAAPAAGAGYGSWLWSARGRSQHSSRAAIGSRLRSEAGWGCEAGLRGARCVRAEPSRAEPSRAEPSRAEPSRAEPSRAEPSRAEPSRAEPSRAEPSRAEPSVRARS